MAFGWSAGDVVAAVKVVAKVVAALREADGASQQFQQTIRDLETLQLILQHLQTLKPTDSDFTRINAICAQSQTSQSALHNLLDDFQKFERSLGATAVKGWHRGAHRKTQWALFASK